MEWGIRQTEDSGCRDRSSATGLSRTDYGGGPRGASEEERVVRRGFNLCVAPSQDVVSYFGGGESVKAFGRSGRDEGKNVVDNQTEEKYRNRYRMHIYGVLIQCNDVH
jgi:hypothetical protein